MASNLPKHGVQAIVEGVDKFVKDITSVNKALDNSGKVAASAAKNITPVNHALDGLNDKLKGLVKQSGPAGNALGGVLDKLAGIPPSALLAAAGVAAVVAVVVGLGAATLALGQRGAPLVGLATSFDTLTASVGLSSQALLVDLREAAAGTVADFDLIKQANLALAGAQGEFGKQFGEALPKILEIARVQARATGQDVGFLYQSLVTGIKRASPLLIDNTGITLKIGEANEAYAQSIGKTVAQMTEQDKQLAVLNATLASGQIAIDNLGSTQETNAEKIARVNASITNIFDSLAVSVQPVFGMILDGVQKLVDVFGGFAPYLALIFQFVGKIIAGIVNFIGDIIPPDLGPRLFKGAAAAFGSFANGIISVANKLIFPAVIGIAKFIADFLIGFSPPKLGPLSKIDEGGANLMEAWLGGISGVSLDPVKEVAAQVSAALGDIGKQNLKTVNARLAQLDKALLPFQNRLDIVKATFDALNEPAKLALDAIDRQAEGLQEAIARGDSGALDRLRVLDQQRDAIQAQVDAQQGIVDASQIQLALAKAQQGPERALLAIRKAYLESLIKKGVVKAAPQTGGAGSTGNVPAGGAGAAAPLPVTPVAGGGLTTGEIPSVLDLIGGQDKVDAAAAELSDAFMGAIDETGLATFAQNQLDLGSQLDRIGTVDLGGKIADKFKSLTDAFDPTVDGSIANKITTFVTTLTGPAEMPGSIASFFATLPANISNAASGLFDSIKTNVFDPVINFLIGTGEGTLSDVLNQAVTIVGLWPALIVDALRNFGGMVYNAIVVPIINVLNSGISAMEAGIRNIASFFANFLGDIINKFDTAEIAGTTLGGLVPQSLRDFQAALAGAGSSFTIGRISTQLPAFLQPLGGATGGMFSSGLMRVGERGPELMYNASRTGVLPNQLVQVLGDLSSILAQPQPMPVFAGGNNYDNSSSINATFNGVQGANDVMRRMSRLRGRG